MITGTLKEARDRSGFVVATHFVPFHTTTAVRDPKAIPWETIPGGGLVFSALIPKPIHTNLSGKIRVRLRAGEFASAVVMDLDGARRFHLADFGDHWELALEHAGNVRYRPQ